MPGAVGTTVNEKLKILAFTNILVGTRLFGLKTNQKVSIHKCYVQNLWSGGGLLVWNEAVTQSVCGWRLH